MTVDTWGWMCTERLGIGGAALDTGGSWCYQNDGEVGD
jgi:hypothetical protein